MECDMLRYPALFDPDEGGGFVVTFRDIPEAITQGDTLEEARSMAADALLTAMDFYFEDKRAVPAPSKAKKGEDLVALPASVSAKVLLLNAMIDGKVTPAELARRLNTTPQAVNRIVDIGHATKIDTIAEALEALGKHLEIGVV
jgi:antitoxin HicB